MHRDAFVQGASRGLGLELVRQLLSLEPGTRVYASCRDPSSATSLQSLRATQPDRLRIIELDVTCEQSIELAAEQVAQETSELGLTLNVAGVLHGAGFGPEKKLAQVTPEALRWAFEVNAFGPLLMAKHFHGFLRHEGRSVFASLSARIGSISDNRLGGWYAYRGSKAAQNMFTKTVAIELARLAPKAIVVGLHPGTVRTELSAPFLRNVHRDNVLTVEESARRLLAVISKLQPRDSGKIFDHRGHEILP
jgi:NAD(P)-dependent dehydrogenase (short-subunit alcohol dehydrogenase family)